MEAYLKDCKKVEKICSQNESFSPIKSLEIIEKEMPSFLENCQQFYKKSNPEKNLIHFSKLIKKLSESKSNEEGRKSKKAFLRTLDLLEEKNPNLDLSFDNLDNKENDQIKITSKSSNSNQNNSLHREILQLKKREHGMIRKIDDLEKKLSMVLIDNNRHIRKTYQIQSQMLTKLDFDSSNLLQLNPYIEMNVGLKLYFWALYRRFHFFARTFDLFRKQFLRVRELPNVRFLFIS
jgi:hypothetical protein